MFALFGPKVPQIDATDAKKAIDANKKIMVLDVRTPQEFAKGNIQNSTNLPLDQIARKITKTISDKDQTIFAYCLSGSRSTSAVTFMQKQGFTHVFNMTNGLLAWRAKGYPLTQ